MKSYIVKPHNEEIYPCLKILTMAEDHNRYFIVRFIKESTGVVVHDPHGIRGLGDYSTNWAEEEDFDLFHGQITLEN